MMSCNIYTCHRCHFVIIVINESSKRALATAGMPGEETLRRPAFPADPPATGAVADPDRGGARHLAELRQPDRAQPAPGHRADPASAGGGLRPRSARPRDRRRRPLLRRAERDLLRSAVSPDRPAEAGIARSRRALPRRHPRTAAALRRLYRGAARRNAGRRANAPGATKARRFDANPIERVRDLIEANRNYFPEIGNSGREPARRAERPAARTCSRAVRRGCAKSIRWSDPHDAGRCHARDACAASTATAGSS